MNRSIVIVALLSMLVLGFITIVRSPSLGAQSGAPFDPVSPELAYLKQVNQWRPPSDPQLLFILMQQFANAGRHVEGIAYFEEALNRFASGFARRKVNGSASGSSWTRSCRNAYRGRSVIDKTCMDHARPVARFGSTAHHGSIPILKIRIFGWLGYRGLFLESEADSTSRKAASGTALYCPEVSTHLQGWLVDQLTSAGEQAVLER